MHNKRFCRLGVFAGDELPDTLLGFETTSPPPLCPAPWGTGGGCALEWGWVVVAPSLVVGCVVFDSWIVVASISQMRFLPFRGWGLVCGCAISNIGFVFVSV